MKLNVTHSLNRPAAAAGANDLEIADFNTWFKGSKVADELGRPKLLHHGTNHQFSVFDTTEGAWFTSSVELTSDYGLKRRIDAYLAIRNPYISSHRENIARGSMALIQKARALGHDGIYLPRDEATFQEFVCYEADSDVWVAFDPRQIRQVDKAADDAQRG